MHQRIRNPQPRILPQKPFRHLLFKGQNILRQRFDLVHKFVRYDHYSVMGCRDGKSGILILCPRPIHQQLQ